MPEFGLCDGRNLDLGSLFYLDPNPDKSPAVLLLHGLGADSSSWQLQIPALAGNGFRPLAPDLPGFGRSSHFGGRWSIRYAAQCVKCLADRQQISSLHVVGISMGGTVALQLALDYPDLVDRLVLVSAFARLAPDSLRGWLYFIRRAMLVWGRGLQAQADYVARRIFPSEDQQELRRLLIEQIMQADPGVYKQAMRSLGFFNVQNRLGEIRSPTLVVTGNADTTVPVRNQRPLAEKIKGARQVLFPEAGHALCVEQPDRFNQVLLSFLCLES